MLSRDLIVNILWRISDWPDVALNELFEAMGKIEERHGLFYELNEEERVAIEKALEEVERGEFASEEEVRATFERYKNPGDGEPSS